MPPAPPPVEEPKVLPSRSGRQFNFWASQELSDALDSYMDSIGFKTLYKEHLEKALKLYLQTNGYWPPKPKNKGHGPQEE